VASLAVLAALNLLAHAVMFEVLFWLLLSAVCGFAMAGIYTIAESLLNVLASRGNRGRLYSVYMTASWLTASASPSPRWFSSSASCCAWRWPRFRVLGFVMSVALFGLLTAIMAPIYGVGAALANDRAGAGCTLATTGTLLFVNGIGAAVGPISAGLACRPGDRQDCSCSSPRLPVSSALPPLIRMRWSGSGCRCRPVFEKMRGVDYLHPAWVSADVELHTLRQGQMVRIVDGVGSAAHIRLPRIRTALAAATGFLFATEGAADFST
jgi:hypothetical protein